LKVSKATTNTKKCSTLGFTCYPTWLDTKHPTKEDEENFTVFDGVRLQLTVHMSYEESAQRIYE